MRFLALSRPCPNQPRPYATLAALFIGLMALFLSSGVPAQEYCGSLERQHGPFDYNNSSHRSRHLGVVERRHFTDKVRSLRGGETGPIGGDLAYVLNWFPNHHLALDAMSRLATRDKTNRPRGSDWSVDCWFDRAIRFRARDANVRLLQGLHYQRTGERQKSREALLKASELASDIDGQLQYNLGLALFRVGEYELAREHATIAYRLGHPLPGLRNLLEGKGYSLPD